MNKNKIYVFFFIILCFFSCKKNNDQILSELFSIKMGYNENEVGINLNEHNLIDYNIDFIHRNNFFYITDKINNKIMKFTEKGQLILVIYNPNTNTFFETHKDFTPNSDQNNSEVISTKIYKTYNLINPEKIESDTQRNIYVVDNNQDYKVAKGNHAISDQFLLKFDNNGDFIHKIGKNGIDTEPFSYISQLFIDKDDNLVVQEMEETGYIIYVFNKSGILTKKCSIARNDAPRQQNEENLIIDVVDVKLSRTPNIIYVTCQYIRESIESHLISKYETIYEKLYTYNLDTDKFEKMVTKVSPKYIDMSKNKNPEIEQMYNNQKKVILPMNEFLGIDDFSNTYFIKKELPTTNINNNNFTLIAYAPNFHEIYNKYIKYSIDIVYTSPLVLSAQGEIFSYYIKDGEINIVQIK